MRVTKLLLVVFCLMAAVAGCGKGPEQVQQPLGTPAQPQPQLAGLSFQQVSFQDPVAKNHTSAWKKNSKKVSVTREGDGLRCEVEAGSGTESNYGGVAFPVSGGIKALRLEMTLISPENINGVWVDGKKGKTRMLRWVWPVGRSARGSGRATYVLVPGGKSRPFGMDVNKGGQGVEKVDIFIRLRGPNQKAGFILHRVEVAN